MEGNFSITGIALFKGAPSLEGLLFFRKAQTQERLKPVFQLLALLTNNDKYDEVLPGYNRLLVYQFAA